MNNQLVTEISIVPVKPKYGHIAFASFVIYESFYLNAVAVYTRFGGGIRLVYPRKKNLDICHPTNSDVGRQIEEAVYEEMIRYEFI